TTSASIELYSLSLHDALPILLNFGIFYAFDSMTLTKTGAQNPSDEAQVRQLKHELQLPLPPENQPAARDSLAKQQAEAAIELLKDRKSTRLNSSHVSTSYAVF